MTAQATQTASTEAMALGLGLVITIGRFIFEVSETLKPMRMGFPDLTLPQVQGLVWNCLTRPLFYFSVVYTSAVVFFPLMILRRLNTAFASKTSDLTQGSIAKGELDD